jgi:hypothetical protein
MGESGSACWLSSRGMHRAWNINSIDRIDSPHKRTTPTTPHECNPPSTGSLTCTVLRMYSTYTLHTPAKWPRAQIRVTASTHHAPRAYVVQDLGGALQRRPALSGITRRPAESGSQCRCMGTMRTDEKGLADPHGVPTPPWSSHGALSPERSSSLNPQGSEPITSMR